MIQQRVLLDTDTLSAIMRQNPVVILKAREYLAQQGKFTFSLITRYEILRGLKAKAATRQLMAFEKFCANNIIVPASALVLGIPVVTNNESHFCYVDELVVQNWLIEL